MNFFQGFCQWNAPAYSFPVDLSGPTPFKPNPPSPTHIGQVNGIQFQLTASMTQNPTLPMLKFEITCSYGGTPLETLHATIAAPQSLDPFDSGLIQFPVSDPADLVTVRVWT